MPAQPPSLYDWLDGIEALNKLTTRFCARVKDNAVLAPIFAHLEAERPRHVAAFLAEVLGGPSDYSGAHGGHPHMIGAHLNRHLTQPQRCERIARLLDAGDRERGSTRMRRCPNGAGAWSVGRTGAEPASNRCRLTPVAAEHWQPPNLFVCFNHAPTAGPPHKKAINICRQARNFGVTLFERVDYLFDK
jgi:truncated hemoglobin YjbI